MTKPSIKIIALLSAGLLAVGCIATDGETDSFDEICLEGQCDLEPEGAGLQDNKIDLQQKKDLQFQQCPIIKVQWLCEHAGCVWEWDTCVEPV